MSTMADELTRDLYANLVDQLYAAPAHTRKRSRWVMNHEWWDECRKIGGGWPEAGITTMLGLPFKITDDGGFPHLAEDWHHG